ncbi:thiol-disulfide isomerase/thioredoxin [Rhodanobacter sp. TND4EL1]
MKKSAIFRPLSLLASALLVSGLALSGCGQQNAPSAAPAASASAAAPSAETPKSGFVITGSLPSLKDGDEVRLLMYDASADTQDKRRPVATTKVEHGSFRLTGSVKQPLPGLLQVGHDSADMIVENAPFKLVNTGQQLVVEGGQYNDKVYGYRALPEFVAALKARRELNREAFKGVDEQDEVAMKAARAKTKHSQDAEIAITNDWQAKVLDSDASPLLKLFVLKDNQDYQRYDKARREAMLAEYEKALGADHPLVVEMNKTAAGYRKYEQLQSETSVGKHFKDVIAIDKDGHKVKLSDVLGKNKLVLLDFWASWCGPCRGEFPHLAKVYKEFHPHGFEIYAISLDDDNGEWLKALREEGKGDGIPWINLVDHGIDSKSATSYGILGLPSNFLINSDGTIVGVNMREWDVEREVRAQVSKVEGGHGA